MSFWERYPDMPKPGHPYRTRDQRRNLDLCVWPGSPVEFQMDEGVVTQNRYWDLPSNTVVIDIDITDGPGTGLVLVYGHVNPDIDPAAPGLQYVPVDSVVHRGDTIAYTNLPPDIPETILNFGAIRPSYGDYDPDQEMMYIGPDGQLNLLR